MQKVLIIEDDHFSARRLKRLIMDIDDTIDVHGPLKSVAEVTEELAANNDYDLIFSDIRLADGDVFEAFRKVMPQSFVIFTTAYDEYAMEAIKNNGLDYLMKPIDADELRAAIGKLRLNRNAQQSAVVSPLRDVLNDTRQYRERFLITKGDELCMQSSSPFVIRKRSRYWRVSLSTSRRGLTTADCCALRLSRSLPIAARSSSASIGFIR